MTETKTVKVRSVPADLWRRVRVAAAKRGIRVNEFVIDALVRRVSAVEAARRSEQ